MNKKYNKNINAGLASVMALGSIVVAAPMTTEASAKFLDLNTNNQHYNAIVNLAERGIIKGFGDGTFKPGQSVTRGQAAKIIAGVLELDTTNVVNPGFTDVPTTHEYYGAIAALANAGIIRGYGDGTFGHGKTVTRNHMAKMIAGAFELTAPAESTLPFKDVSAESEYAGYITALYAKAITTGTTPTTFSGASNVTRGQLASLVVRAETTLTPDVPTTEEVTFTIDAVKKDTVGGYKISDSVKAILNEKNNEALSDALLSVNVRNKEIVAVNSIELNAAGTAEKAIVFNGANSAIEGDLTINADYVEVKNITVKGDVSITRNVANAFSADGLVSEGQLTIEKDGDALASLVQLFANNKKGPKVDLKNSEIKNVIVKREGVTLESDSKLGEVQISDKVSSIQLNANSGKVVVDATVPLEISGKGTIDEVQLVKAIEVALEISGAIGKLTVEDVKAKVDVAKTLIINQIEAKGADVKEIIKNYDQVKENIKEIIGDGEVKPTPAPTPSPSPTPAPKPTPSPETGTTPPGEQLPVTLSGIAVTKQPSKTTYKVGEQIDLNGLEVTGTYSDGSKKAITVTLAMISGLDSTVANPAQVVTVTVDGKTATFTVKIEEDDSMPPALTSVVVHQTKPTKQSISATTSDSITVELAAGSHTESIVFTFSEAIAGLASGDTVYLNSEEYGTVALSDDKKTLTIRTIVDGELNEDGSNSTGHIPANKTEDTITLAFTKANGEEIVIKDLAGNVLDINPEIIISVTPQ